jgi:hypothetical protein
MDIEISGVFPRRLNAKIPLHFPKQIGFPISLVPLVYGGSLHRIFVHWALGEGGVVIACPIFDQSPRYWKTPVKHADGKAVSSLDNPNVVDALKHDHTCAGVGTINPGHAVAVLAVFKRKGIERIWM